MRLVVVLFAASVVLAREQPPEWVLRGILKVETRSAYAVNGEIVYVDMRRGSAGERGPFQMRRIAFDQVAKPGEQFWRIESDRKFAEEMAIRYLNWLYEKSQSWDRAVEWYNAGPGNRSRTYLKLVREHGSRGQ